MSFFFIASCRRRLSYVSHAQQLDRDVTERYTWTLEGHGNKLGMTIDRGSLIKANPCQGLVALVFN
jgi:hypothetical protein